MVRLAISSSIGVPRKMIRSLRARDLRRAAARKEEERRDDQSESRRAAAALRLALPLRIASYPHGSILVRQPDAAARARDCRCRKSIDDRPARELYLGAA